MVAWLLTWNPRKFDLEAMLRDGEELDSWSVGRFLSELHSGDQFALWRSGQDAGVVATGILTGSPAQEAQPSVAQYWSENPGPQWYAPLKVDTWLDYPVPRSWFTSNPLFESASIVTQPFAANPHRLSDAQWTALKLQTQVDAPQAIAEGFEPGTDTSDWYLKPGEEIRRVELHNRYGGSRQGGISPSTKTPNVLFFTDPATGLQHGYDDEWETNDIFRYTGEGQRGPQQFTHGNKAIRDHAHDGRHLRLFIGSRGVVRYAGEWVLDPETPYSWGQAPPTGGGDLRPVIHFHMHRVGSAVLNPDVPIGSEYRPAEEETTLAPAKPSAPDPDLMGRNLQAHRRLQNELAQAVRDRGMTPLSPSPADPAFDLAWRTTHVALTVCEVKSLTPANESHQLRTGLGQALDYMDQLSARAQVVRGVLWVERQPTDLRWVGLCNRVGVVLAWPGADTQIWPA